MEDLLTVTEIAGMLKLNQQTVRNWIDRDYLPAVRIGRQVRIRRADFEALLDASVIVPKQPADPSLARAFWDGELEQLPIAPEEL